MGELAIRCLDCNAQLAAWHEIQSKTCSDCQDAALCTGGRSASFLHEPPETRGKRVKRKPRLDELDEGDQ